MRLSNRENTVSPALAHAPTGKRRDDFALGKFEHGKGNGGRSTRPLRGLRRQSAQCEIKSPSHVANSAANLRPREFPDSLKG